VERYLQKCVDSILAQSYSNIEVVLVDDGSTDESVAICDSYANRDKRVQVIHKENGGASSARNEGLSFAHGSYIAFIDSDDYVSPSMAEKLLDAISKTDSDLAMCNFAYTDELGNITESFSDDTKAGEYRTDELLCKVAAGWTFGILVWNKLFKKELFDGGLLFLEGRIAEDEMIAHRLLARVRKAVIIPDVLCFYRQRTGSVTNSAFNEKNLDSLEALIDRVEFFISINEEGLAYIASVTAMKNLADLWSFRNKSKEIKAVLKSYRTRIRNLCGKIGKQQVAGKYVVSVFLFEKSFPLFLLMKRLWDFIK
jgi:glycosyltransferase involved in cell wall biosynthesis